ncbi:MAG: hypothetical protein H7Y09_04570 [Chitinophagaceae bacterium]|nr:hypothetical protein [Anaerolineae bacterium]
MTEGSYVIKAKPQLKEWLEARNANSDDIEILTALHSWNTYSRLFIISTLTPAEDAARLKLLFLAFMSSLFPDDSEDSAFFTELLGTAPWTLATFDRWWTVERVDVEENLHEVVEEIEIDDLERIGQTGISGVDSWIASLIKQKSVPQAD